MRGTGCPGGEWYQLADEAFLCESLVVPRTEEPLADQFNLNVNRLYDEALGLYRLDIALLIAQKSQKVKQSCDLLTLGSSRILAISAKAE